MDTQLASKAGGLCIVDFVKGADVGGWEFEPIVDWDEELGDLAVVGNESLREVVLIDGVEGVGLNESLDLVLQITDLSVVHSGSVFQRADESCDDQPKFQ